MIIGDKIYKFKKDAILHYREILNSYNFGASLNEEDFKDLINLLSIENDNIKNSEADLNNSSTKETFTFNKNHFSNYQLDAIENKDNRYIKCPTSKTKIVDYK